MQDIYFSRTPLAFWLILALAASNYHRGAQAYIVNLQPGEREVCFYEIVEPNIKMIFSFEVADGGHLDIDVRVKDPNGLVLYRKDAAESGKFEHTTTFRGNHQLCFSNVMSSQKEKYVLFEIDRSDMVSHKSIKEPSADGSTEEPDKEISRLEDMVEDLLLSTVGARHDVRYLTTRDKNHRKLSEATNSTVVYWSLVEFLLLLVVTAGQVWYLKRFFETRRKT